MPLGANGYVVKPVSSEAFIDHEQAGPVLAAGEPDAEVRGRVFRNSFFAERVLPILKGD